MPAQLLETTHLFIYLPALDTLDKDLREVFKSTGPFISRGENMVDLSQQKIQDLFYQQIRRLTLKNKETLSVQFSDAWL